METMEIARESWAEALRVYKTILSNLNTLSKCASGRHDVEALGHRVSYNGVFFLEGRVQAN